MRPASRRLPLPAKRRMSSGSTRLTVPHLARLRAKTAAVANRRTGGLQEATRDGAAGLDPRGAWPCDAWHRRCTQSRVESTVLLTLSALLLGVTVTTAAPAPPESSATELAAFDAPPPTLPPIARHRSELRDPFAAP